jgi:hypothetical protein
MGMFLSVVMIVNVASGNWKSHNVCKNEPVVCIFSKKI